MRWIRDDRRTPRHGAVPVEAPRGVSRRHGRGSSPTCGTSSAASEETLRAYGATSRSSRRSSLMHHGDAGVPGPEGIDALAVRGFVASLSREGLAQARRSRASSPPCGRSCAMRCAKGASRSSPADGVAVAARAAAAPARPRPSTRCSTCSTGSRTTTLRPSATGRSSSCSTPRACASASSSALDLDDVDLPRHARPRPGQGAQGAHRALRQQGRATRLRRWLAASSALRGDGRAPDGGVPEPARRPADRSQRAPDPRPPAARGGDPGADLAPRAAALVRHAPARRGRRSAGDPGAARPLVALDDAALHPRQHRCADAGLRPRASRGPAERGARRSGKRACRHPSSSRRPRARPHSAAGARAARSFPPRATLARRAQGAPRLRDRRSDREAEPAVVALSAVASSRPRHHGRGRDPDARSWARYRWVVDPLDGTTNFIHGVPTFARLGRARGRRWARGRRDPRPDARRDVPRPARWRRAAQRTETDPLQPAGGAARGAHRHGVPVPRAAPARPRTCARSRRSSARRRGCAGPAPRALDLAYTACGRYDGFWEVGLSRWDIAAGVLLVREAGGVVTDWLGRDRALETRRHRRRRAGATPRPGGDHPAGDRWHPSSRRSGSCGPGLVLFFLLVQVLDAVLEDQQVRAPSADAP